jgi:hypothetical protein
MQIDANIMAGNPAAELIVQTMDPARPRGDPKRQHLNTAAGESAEPAREVATT